ncbi:MAG: GNAT family N-acetyltransferase [Bacteroidales bacterium]|nr:GNAT family N-acetyltransferase [Bacteroidales bacterium]
MTVTVKEIHSRRELRRFITFPEKLYKDNPYWVHSLHSDEFDTLGDKNPALEFCERALYLAYKDGRAVGRVAAIINHNANRRWNEEVVRFGWIDFIDDLEVLRALIGAVESWGRARGCVKIKGPLGFSDLDKEGLLVEGFDHLSPFTVIYNYPYYGERLEQLGFVKDADWTQKIVDIPDEVPQMQYVPLVEQRFGLHAVTDMSMKEMGKKFGVDLFHLINTSFAELYEYSPLSDKQIDSYLKVYIPILNKDFVAVIVDSDDQVAGFAFCVPSLSKAFRKARGRLFPFGFIHILRALKKNDSIDALMIGVLPQYQGKGASLLIFKYLLESCHKYGIKRMYANPQLETNHKVQSLFDGMMPTHEFQRRRSYVKSL